MSYCELTNVGNIWMLLTFLTKHNVTLSGEKRKQESLILITALVRFLQSKAPITGVIHRSFSAVVFVLKRSFMTVRSSVNTETVENDRRRSESADFLIRCAKWSLTTHIYRLRMDGKKDKNLYTLS